MISNHTYRDFVFTISHQPQEPAYTVDFLDIADIITSGDTLSEAFQNACEALDLHLESLQKLNQPLPQPSHRLVLQQKEKGTFYFTLTSPFPSRHQGCL